MAQKVFVTIRQKITYISRGAIYLAIFSCLLLPLFFLASKADQELFFLAFPYGCLGSAGIWFFLRLLEKNLQKSMEQLILKNHQVRSLDDQDKEISRLNTEIFQLRGHADQKLEEMRLAYLEFEDLRKEYDALEEDAKREREESKKELQQKEALLKEYQKTIAEQRALLERRQNRIVRLESKVHDLMQELRNVLQLDTAASKKGLNVNEEAILDSFLTASSVTNAFDLSVQLHTSIEKMEALTGVDHLGGKAPRFLDLSLESYVVDKRRLFDSFKDESAIVFIYSLPENKFLFVSHFTKKALGINAEKFIKEFSHLVVEGYSEWEQAMAKTRSVKECSVKLSILNKAGSAIAFECRMGKIAKGPFAHHVLGILASVNAPP